MWKEVFPFNSFEVSYGNRNIKNAELSNEYKQQPESNKSKWSVCSS